MNLANTLSDLIRHSKQSPRALPTSVYLDPEFFQAELDQVLRPGWHAIARADELPETGDFRSFDLLGEPIVLVRDENKQLRAFSRVCLHRACIFVEGEGNTNRFTCPFHRWGYGLDGSLTAAPLMDDVPGFERNQQRLPELALESWQGFVLRCGHLVRDADRRIRSLPSAHSCFDARGVGEERATGKDPARDLRDHAQSYGRV